jgi:hypothetical protein
MFSCVALRSAEVFLTACDAVTCSVLSAKVATNPPAGRGTRRTEM